MWRKSRGIWRADLSAQVTWPRVSATADCASTLGQVSQRVCLGQLSRFPGLGILGCVVDRRQRSGLLRHPLFSLAPFSS